MTHHLQKFDQFLGDRIGFQEIQKKVLGPFTGAKWRSRPIFSSRRPKIAQIGQKTLENRENVPKNLKKIHGHDAKKLYKCPKKNKREFDQV